MSKDWSESYFGNWLEFRYRQEDIPGFVVAVWRDGQLLFNKAYGYADLEKKIKMTPDHLFRIASHSKTFTATALMQLAEQGKLRIDDKVVDHLAWLADHKDKRWQNVTIRQLMSHGAGVIRDGMDSNYWQLDRPFPDEATFKKEILEAELVIDNNVRMKYSNYGYTLLGMIVAAASGQAYNDYVTENIVKPLGLKNTGPELTKKIESRLVTGYYRGETGKNPTPIEQIDTRAMSPATGFYSNSSDLIKYFSAHMVGSGKLLSDESKKEMQRTHWQVDYTNDREDYGLGFEIEYIKDTKLIGHGGGFPGHSTTSLFDPETKMIVIVLTNAMKTGPMFVAKNIFKTMFLAMDYAKPKSDLQKYQGRYMGIWGTVDILAAGNKLLSLYPGTWEPFEYPEELSHQSGDIFKITKAGGFDAEGEMVKFNFDNGKIKSVTYAGSTLLPEEEFLSNMRKIKKISLNNE